MKISYAHRSVLACRRVLFRSTGILAVGLGATGALLTMGCGNTLYLVQVNQAEEAFEEARELGAEQYSPYEYYSAEARLKEAKTQAAQAEYGNASDLSDEATEYAQKAIVKAKKSRSLSIGAPARLGANQ